MTNRVTESNKVLLIRTDDRKVFTEGDVVWILTEYTESPCWGYCDDNCPAVSHVSECAVCQTMITDMDHFVCLDGGDSAHIECVVIM